MDMEMDMGTDMETDMETDTEMSQWTKVGRGHVGARCTRWRARGHLSARRPLRVARWRGGGPYLGGEQPGDGAQADAEAEDEKQ